MISITYGAKREDKLHQTLPHDALGSLTPQTNLRSLLNFLHRPTSTPYYLPSQTYFRSLLYFLPKPTQLAKCEVVACRLILYADIIPINGAQRQAQRHGQADRDNAHHFFQGPWPVWYGWHSPW